MVYRLILSYRGTAYGGWQRQRNAPTVQQQVEEAVADLVGYPVQVVGASRTDAGVHARGQAAHVELKSAFPARGLVHGTNQRLPRDIRVLRASRMPEGFHARKRARAKEYSYRLVRAHIQSPLDELFAVRVNPEIDLEAMRKASRLILGRHDFSAFALAGGSHRSAERTVFLCEWREEREQLVLRIVGDGFLRGMVRSLVGTMLEVGAGRRPVESFAELLEGRERSEAGPTAPAAGLVLERVIYRGESGDLELVEGKL